MSTNTATICEILFHSHDFLNIPGRPDEQQTGEVFEDRLPDETFSPLPSYEDLHSCDHTRVDSPELSPSPVKEPSPIKAPEPSPAELAEAKAQKQQRPCAEMPPPPTPALGLWTAELGGS